MLDSPDLTLKQSIIHMSEEITFSKYQEQTGKTAVYPEETPLQYLSLGITGEAREISEKVKKKGRDGN